MWKKSLDVIHPYVVVVFINGLIRNLWRQALSQNDFWMLPFTHTENFRSFLFFIVFFNPVDFNYVLPIAFWNWTGSWELFERNPWTSCSLFSISNYNFAWCLSLNTFKVALWVIVGFETKSSVSTVKELRLNFSYVLREVAGSDEETYAIFHSRKTEGFC